MSPRPMDEERERGDESGPERERGDELTPEHAPGDESTPEHAPGDESTPEHTPGLPASNPAPDRKPAAKTGFSWKNQPPPSRARITLWVVVGGIGLYYLGSGILGLLTH
ncbi:MAG: hypothetical protein ABI255_10990 [Microbacteriaceae bacterium]